MCAQADGDGDEDAEVALDDLPPLFMQVTLTVKEGRKFLKSFPVRSLPTCIFDLARDAVTSCYDETDDGISELDIADLNITLDLVCMMQSEVREIKPEAGAGGGGSAGGGPSSHGTRSVLNS